MKKFQFYIDFSFIVKTIELIDEHTTYSEVVQTTPVAPFKLTFSSSPVIGRECSNPHYNRSVIDELGKITRFDVAWKKNGPITGYVCLNDSDSNCLMFISLN